MPMDLRIGSKVRVISKKPFPWMNNSRATGIFYLRLIYVPITICKLVGVHDVKIPGDDVEKALNISRNGYAEYSDVKLLQRVSFQDLENLFCEIQLFVCKKYIVDNTVYLFYSKV